MKNIVTSEPIRDRNGQPVRNGYLKLDLEDHAVLRGGGHILPVPVHVSLNEEGKLGSAATVIRYKPGSLQTQVFLAVSAWRLPHWAAASAQTSEM